MDILPHAHQPESVSSLLNRLVTVEGTASHSYCAPAIARAADAFVRDAVDFADAVHLLSLLHGQAPGAVNHAESRITENAARSWLVQAVNGFGRERSYLAQLVVAVGPMPSTTGQQSLSQTISQQRRALEMLSLSDRRGCALGAAAALVLDWHAIRAVLAGGAARLVEEAEMERPIGRALQFGASQVLGQHRGIWDLLSARSQARRDAPY
jgi:hypothetical protein